MLQFHGIEAALGVGHVESIQAEDKNHGWAMVVLGAKLLFAPGDD
ncbi:hypothetical protein [Methyloraptor flagellatus]|uniref:Uncharacterized protein n=1 Tax=Methyloraptor flagellatus TaxID=3162530 RepID=A0AAU7XCH3_9HYPH